ncbi:MAG: transcription elongation factor GreA [Chloroflexi bacterium]|nr:transcription elongation factor GreA [Chloroflexota bacterium]MDA8187911.1 transcription elongation factor GreA [Dehalococcoidales bacterium]
MHESTWLLTAEGRQKLLAELEYLTTVRRKEVAEQLQQARQLSDGWDSPEYLEAKNAQSFVEGRIRTLERMLAEASIIDAQKGTSKPEEVCVGSRVRVRNEDGEEEVFTIVGSAECDARAGKISNQSPVGGSLLGKRVGENVEVQVPAGIRRFVVLEIE